MTGVRASVLSRRPGRACHAAVAAHVALVALAPTATAQFRPSPWATINVCDPSSAPGSVGVRVSVPNRADAAQWARIRIQFFDGTRGAWRVVRKGGDSGFVRLSDGGGRVFGGTTFTFTPPARGLLVGGRDARQSPQRRRPVAGGVAGDLRDRALTG